MIQAFLGPLLGLMVAWCSTAQPAVGEAVAITQGRQPHATVDGQGTVWVTFARDREILFTASTDGGHTFQEPRRVAQVSAMDLGMRRGPRIASADGALILTVIAGEQARGRDGDIHFWRSSDGGKSWVEPGRINSVPGSAREGLQATAAAGKHVAIVWLDMRDGATTLYGAFSDDAGGTFSADRMLYNSPDGHICECCAPQVAVDSKGRIAVMFRNWLKGNRDMYLMTSTDAGKSFSPPRKHGRESWSLDACPMDGGAVTIEGDEITAVWRREGRLYGTNDTFDPAERSQPAAEQAVATGENASLAVSQVGTHTAFQGEGGRIMYRGSLSPGTAEVSPSGQDPVIVWSPKMRAPLVLWEDEGKVFARTLQKPLDR